MARITVTLREDERQALVAMAASELRDPRDQARAILREEMQRRGLLKGEIKSSQQVGKGGQK